MSQDSSSNPPASPNGPLAGGVVGLVVGGVLALMIGFAVTAKTRADARRGWLLKPVVVVNEDLAAGTVLTFDMIAQRSVPEQFVTASVVKPAEASTVVNKALRAPMHAGDFLLYSELEADASDRTVLLFATRDLSAGARLTEVDLEPRSVTWTGLTPSFAREADRAQAVGRTLLAPVRHGDPLLWTHLTEQMARTKR